MFKPRFKFSGTWQLQGIGMMANLKKTNKLVTNQSKVELKLIR